MVKSFSVTTTKHNEVSRNPSHHFLKETFGHNRRHDKFSPQLITTSVSVDDVGSNAELAELGTSSCVLEDGYEQTRSENSSVFVEGILNYVNGVVQQVLDIIFLSEVVERAELPDMGIESATQFDFKTLDLCLRSRFVQCERGGSLRNIALKNISLGHATTWRGALPYRANHRTS